MMKTLFDTSVLVAAMVVSHPAHERAFSRLQEVRRKEYKGIVSAHSLAEIYAVVTKLPVQPKVSPRNAKILIDKNVVELFDVVSLDNSDYISLVADLSRNNITGGAVYDALIVKAGLKAGANRIFTLNPKDFKRVCPENANLVLEP
jgi:predicted nucleic acid-binding protein